jgi:hypothetical protein
MAATRSGRSSCCPTLFEAFPAVDGAPLGWLEGYGSFLAALRTNGAGFHAPTPLSIEQLTSLGLTGLTALRLVFEPLIREEKLFACRENEFRSAIDALEDPIPVFHDMPPMADQSRA